MIKNEHTRVSFQCDPCAPEAQRGSDFALVIGRWSGKESQRQGDCERRRRVVQPFEATLKSTAAAVHAYGTGQVRALVVAGSLENGQAGDVLVQLRQSLTHLQHTHDGVVRELEDMKRMLANERSSHNDAVQSVQRYVPQPSPDADWFTSVDVVTYSVWCSGRGFSPVG